FGNLGRNAFIGPDFKNFDFSLAKDTKLNERLNMQFRADIFNLFNHANFSNPTLPNFLVNLENNGTVTPVPGDPKCNPALNPTFAGCRAVGPGFLPTTATPDVAIGYPFLGGGGPREMRHLVRIGLDEGRPCRGARDIRTAGGISLQPVEPVHEAERIRHHDIGDGE